MDAAIDRESRAGYDGGMRRLAALAVWVPLSGCGPPLTVEEVGVSDCGNQCEPYGPEFPGVGECQEGQCTPTFFECFAKDEYDTCSAACAAAGSVCAENQCADSTYLITVHIDSCLQPETVGVARKGGCDEPIGWQVNTGARCCCEQL